MESIEEFYGENLSRSLFKTPGFFYILFTLIYSLSYGKSKELTKVNPKKISATTINNLKKIEKKVLKDKKNKELKDKKLVELFETRRNTTLDKRKKMVEYLISRV
ncbi:unnamed protein product [marine sediment metagenome]|uniref:Uncharacterized protein n=1 Tax=marine sediment metagenome TaxID=412755 RepID=X1MFW7_9ZZZZ